MRHATRYGLPIDANKTNEQIARQWLLAGGPESQLDRSLGLRRARAATLFELALPGSAYLYQGEELGLHEVADISDNQRQDPTFFRSPGVNVGRDGCRVPLPWEAKSTAFGFGQAQPHLPQPAWFADYAVDVQESDPNSTLNLYRTALKLRRDLQGAEELQWLDSGREDVLAFERPGGWAAMTNFGEEPVALLEGTVLLTSSPLTNGQLAGASTAWLKR